MKDETPRVAEARYDIPIFAGEYLVFQPGRRSSRIEIRREERTLSRKSLLHLGGPRPLVVHFIDRSLPSGGFRHDAVLITGGSDGPSIERIEAPPRVPEGARAVEVSRLAREGGMVFPIRKG